MAHPRNPSGRVSRKISNEEEIINASRKAFPGHNVQGYQLDAFNVTTQLEILAATDIMIGMHGAAFGFTLLLPQGQVQSELHTVRVVHEHICLLAEFLLCVHFTLRKFLIF